MLEPVTLRVTIATATVYTTITPTSAHKCNHARNRNPKLQKKQGSGESPQGSSQPAEPDGSSAASNASVGAELAETKQRIEKLESAGDNWDVTLHALRMRIEQMEMVVFRPGGGAAADMTDRSTAGGGGVLEGGGDAGLAARVAKLVKREMAVEMERAYTELEVNRHIDTSRLESRLQDMGDQASALTERMQKLEENVISEQEHSLKLLDTILRKGM